MAKKKKTKQSSNPLTRTWREIRQTGSEKAFTSAAQKRKWATLLKTSSSLLILILLIGGGTWATIHWYQTPESSLGKDQAPPVDRIIFETNGVLREAWVGRTLAIRPGTTLVELSIFDLKQKLESRGQIETAKVERLFPSTLKVQLSERIPVARLAVEDGFGGYEILLVSGEGQVYRGRDYDPDFLKTLPYLDGVTPQKNQTGEFQPILGMEVASSFLDLLRRDYPALYEDLRVMDLRHIQKGSEIPGASIEVRGRRFPDIRFSSQAYSQQLEKLVYVLDDLSHRLETDRPRESVAAIDLSLEGPVVVSFIDP